MPSYPVGAGDSIVRKLIADWLLDLALSISPADRTLPVTLEHRFVQLGEH